MLWLLAPSLLALLLGRSRRSLLDARVRAWPAILVAFAIELVLYNPPVDQQPWAINIGPWVWLAAQCVFFTVLALNGLAAWPWRVAALGVGLNCLVIALNWGHMPQSPEAAMAVWGRSFVDPTRLQNVAPMDVGTRLAFLGDVIAEPTWLPRANVISVGDILLSLGIASWITMGPRNGTRAHGAARPQQDLSR